MGSIGEKSPVKTVNLILSMQWFEKNGMSPEAVSYTHLEIFENSFIIDTAGFTSLDITKFIENESQIRDAFIEFKYNLECKFSDCKHINEPSCYVKNELENGNISKSRYDSYLFYLNEYLKNRRY